jgi:hypothetical protein
MAAFLREAYSDLIHKRTSKTYGVRRVYWYTWASSYRGQSEIFNWAGLLRYDKRDGSVTPKPAYDTYRDMAQRAEGCAKDEFGACKPPQGP